MRCWSSRPASCCGMACADTCDLRRTAHEVLLSRDARSAVASGTSLSARQVQAVARPLRARWRACRWQSRAIACRCVGAISPARTSPPTSMPSCAGTLSTAAQRLIGLPWSEVLALALAWSSAARWRPRARRWQRPVGTARGRHPPCAPRFRLGLLRVQRSRRYGADAARRAPRRARRDRRSRRAPGRRQRSDPRRHAGRAGRSAFTARAISRSPRRLPTSTSPCPTAPATTLISQRSRPRSSKSRPSGPSWCFIYPAPIRWRATRWAASI